MHHVQLKPRRANMMQNILRLPTVTFRSGISRSTLYLQISQRLWTKPIKIGRRAVGWPVNEVNELIIARIAEQTDDEIRTLVEKLEAARKTVV